MNDVIDKIKAGWTVIALVATLVGSGVAWTAHLQNEISGQIALSQVRSDASYYARVQGELLEQRIAAMDREVKRTQEDIREINTNIVRILQAIERLEERSRNGQRSH